MHTLELSRNPIQPRANSGDNPAPFLRKAEKRRITEPGKRIFSPNSGKLGLPPGDRRRSSEPLQVSDKRVFPLHRKTLAPDSLTVLRAELPEDKILVSQEENLHPVEAEFMFGDVLILDEPVGQWEMGIGISSTDIVVGGSWDDQAMTATRDGYTPEGRVVGLDYSAVEYTLSNTSAVTPRVSPDVKAIVVEPTVDFMGQAEQIFATVAQHALDNTARLVQTYADAWAAHLASCNGADGGHGSITRDASRWTSAYDTAQARVAELMKDEKVMAALARGDKAQAESILQQETLLIYQASIGVDTSKLRSMSKELFSVTDPGQAMIMLQGALAHVGCSCHASQLTAMNSSLFPSYQFNLKGPTLDLSAPTLDLDPKNQHEHKHTEHVCGNCGWRGETCTGDDCPRCNNKNWD